MSLRHEALEAREQLAAPHHVEKSPKTLEIGGREFGEDQKNSFVPQMGVDLGIISFGGLVGDNTRLHPNPWQSEAKSRQPSIAGDSGGRRWWDRTGRNTRVIRRDRLRGIEQAF